MNNATWVMNIHTSPKKAPTHGEEHTLARLKQTKRVRCEYTLKHLLEVLKV